MSKGKLQLGQIPEFLPWPLQIARAVAPRPAVNIEDKYIDSHWHLIGKSGMGKSKLIEGVTLQFVRQGRGFTFIDPHGTSAKSILAALVAMGYFRKNKDAFDRFLYFKLQSDGWFAPLNFLRQDKVPAWDIPDEVLRVLHRSWPELEQGSAQLDTLVLAATTVAVANGLTILSLENIIADRAYRDHLLKNVTDYATLSYFKREYDELRKSYQVNYRQSTTRRLIQLMSRPALAYSLGQSENIYQPRRYMDEEMHIVIDMGDIPNETAKAILGSFFSRATERAAFTRTDLRPDQITNHRLIIDEFQVFSDKSEGALNAMLSQTRKFGLFTLLSHQEWSQMPGLQGALQNCWVDIALQLGPEDAHIMSKWFGTIDPSQVKAEATHPTGQPIFMSLSEQYMMYAKQLMELEPRQALVKFAGKPAVVMETLSVPKFKADPGELAEVEQEYRRRLFRRKEDITLSHEVPWNGTGTITKRHSP